MNPLKNFYLTNTDSSCVHYVDVASGMADLALECTRKGNLEFAVAYGLINESGGVMMSIDGEYFGDKKYLEFGQDKNIPTITASTKELALNLLEYLKNQK